MLLITVILVIFSCVVFAFPKAAGGEASTVTETAVATPVDSDAAVPGYWISLATDADGETKKYYGPPNSKNHLSPPISTSRRTQGTTGWKIDIGPAGKPNIYAYFGLKPSDYEIQALVFALDMVPFPLTGENTSHGYDYDKSAYEGDSDGKSCITCESIDKIDECTNNTDDGFPLDGTCIYIPILARESCANMSDYNQTFCEGVSGIGNNKDILYGSSGGTLPVGAISVPGLGGCYEDPNMEWSNTNTYGRDWFSWPSGTKIPSTSTKQFSPDFKYAASNVDKISFCCGNDPEDVGALITDIEDPTNWRFYNRYICINDSNYAEYTKTGGDFVWIDAQGNQAFMIKYLNNTESKVEYAAVSNSNNWFICNIGVQDDLTKNLYKQVSFSANGAWKGGVVLNEYMLLPKPEETVAWKTESISGPEGGANDGAVNGFQPDYGNALPSSLSDSVDQNDFAADIDQNSVSGGGKVTDCDKDGDGYDGSWSAGATAGVWQDTDLNKCKSPKQPYDCDDGNYGPYPAKYPNLARMRHPGAVDYCLESSLNSNDCKNGNCNLDCDLATECINLPDTGTDPESLKTTPDASLLYPRFMCNNVDQKGDFAECCGWDLEYCFNAEQGRRQGSAIHTVRDFTFFGLSSIDTSSSDYKNRASSNYVLRYGINLPPAANSKTKIEPDDYYRLALFQENNELNITNWSHYQNLEFYVWFTTNFEVELWLGKRVSPKNVISSFVFPYKFRITDYVVNEPELMKWLHVVIPIEAISIPSFTPDVIVFASNVQKLADLGDSVKLMTGTKKGPFSNIVGVDKIHFTPKKADLLESGDENYFCTGTWPPTWISDLDEAEVMDSSDIYTGQSACDAIPSYGWTGTMCCGDDTGIDTKIGNIGSYTEEEYYNDTKAGCWAGNKIADNSRMMVIKYDISYNGGTEEMTRSCRNTTCTYELPATESVFVENKYADVYDLAFVNGRYNPIGVAGLSTSKTSMLRSENVPMQILYYDSNFSGCNAADYIKNLKNTIDGNLLIDGNNLVVSPDSGGMCAIRGGYFCDHRDGANLGWSDEIVKTYNSTVGLTYKDGTQKDLGKDGPTVNATYRIYTKPGYNLIKNGGFENV